MPRLTELLHRSTFWLKAVMMGGTLLLLLLLGAYSMLFARTDSAEIRSAAEQALAGSGRRITFDEQAVGRSLFPRPTVTLRNLRISQTDGTPLLSVKEMKVGMAWSGLLGGGRVIEKWVFTHPEIELRRLPDGNWNISGLLQHGGGSSEINRLIVEDADVRIDHPLRPLHLQHLNLKITGTTGDTPYLEAEGQIADNVLNGINWQLSANAVRNGQSWQLPDFRLDAAGSLYRQAFQLTLNSRLNWQPDSQTVELQQAALSGDLNGYRAHLNASSPSVRLQRGHITLNELNAVLTSTYDQVQWDASLNLGKTAVRPDGIDSGKILFSGSRKSSHTTTAITLDTPLHWQRGGETSLDPLVLTSRMEDSSGNRNPRLNSEWNGSFRRQTDGNWQLALLGLFDRQAAALNAAYTPAGGTQPPQINADIRFDQLNLSHYTGNFSDTPAYPEWLQQSDAPKISAALNIKTLQLPGVEINNLTGRLNADSQSIGIPDLRAELYGGHTEGSLSLTNSRPIGYSLQQHAQNVQILPLMQDLFRYNGLSGRGDARISLNTQGGSRQTLTQNLQGSLQLDVRQGSWLGIDLNNVVQHLQQNGGTAGSQAATPFERFSIDSRIENGIARHEQAELLSDTLSLSARGETDFNRQTLNEQLRISPAKGSGSTIPLLLKGPIDNPSLTVDYNALTAGLNSPQEKQSVLSQALKEQWNWLKPRKTESAP